MISHHQDRLFKPEMLKPPRDFTSPIIEANRSLIIEIGAGKGKHALQYAARHPSDQLIAIERTRAKFDVFHHLAQAATLDNLCPVHADAIPWIIHALPPASVDKVYILYPNPEPNNPNQQWLNMPFFEFLLSRLKEGGVIIVASNIEHYIDNAYIKATQIWCLPTERSLVPSDSQRTHFEVKYLARGERCWQLTMQKPKGYQTHFDEWTRI